MKNRNITEKTAKISTLSQHKTDKYKNFTEEEILPSNQKQIIEQATFVNSPIEKVFEKQTEK